jgi:N-carbamoyl-D-amino-acid hydrolase
VSQGKFGKSKWPNGSRADPPFYGGRCQIYGGSCIVDPNGRIVAQAVTLADEIVIADIDLDLCRQGKDKMFNFAAHRRPEQYAAITERAGVIEPIIFDAV